MGLLSIQQDFLQVEVVDEVMDEIQVMHSEILLSLINLCKNLVTITVSIWMKYMSYDTRWEPGLLIHSLVPVVMLSVL